MTDTSDPAIQSSRPGTLPRSIGGAAELVLRARGHDGFLKRVFDRSPVPMVMIDEQRRYVEVNQPARLAFRSSLAQMRTYTVADMTPPSARPVMEEAWRRLLDAGCVAGSFELAAPDGGRFDVVYWGLADALPGLHLLAFAPAGWSDDELSPPGYDSTDLPRAPLTPREWEVLQLAAKGFSGPSIAEQLTLSPATVKTHFANVYEKLRVGDRAAAVATAMRLGLIH